EKNVRRLCEPSLKKVINMTGIVAHTNLGRAPISGEALSKAFGLMRGYTNLEYDLGEMERGSRYDHVSSLLREIFGSEDALVVNNNAAAVLLVLNEFAKGKEAIVSRGELIEIGGGFRIPEVMEQSGAKLVEAGTTNRTRLSDYEKAQNLRTAVIFKAHRSNFRMTGFVEEASLAELADFAREWGLVSVYDLGSGSILDPATLGLEREPTVFDAVRTGVDIVTFSGDKLLGGPQAGIILGKKNLMERLKKNPLTRALRVCKLTIALLEATLIEYLMQRHENIPIVKMLSQGVKSVEEKAAALKKMISKQGAPKGFSIEIVPSFSQAGGGAEPESNIPSFALEIRHKTLADMEIFRALASQSPPVIGRIVKGAVLLDLRTLQDGDFETAVLSISSAFKSLSYKR
ncbi:MAG: L-seryl-tRNA(Sec) selenium transferase, partial [Deltaproteobacteria bacterium]|nr:L-seryl-tRNA(Sec) selenium transferase [Deltaproteobacteria bacterium]